jgi:hypothetical protein
LGAYRIPSETDVLITSLKQRYRPVGIPQIRDDDKAPYQDITDQRYRASRVMLEFPKKILTHWRASVVQE